MGEMEDSLRGKLLVASPALVDPNFARTVVLITEHNEEGAMGIVLNRPAEGAGVDDLVPEFAGGGSTPAIRAGERGSWRPSSSRTHGSSSRRFRPSCSPTTPRRCGTTSS